jgi:hypothetical protein
METKKFVMFSGCCLDRYERSVGFVAANVEKLEDSYPCGDDGWLQAALKSLEKLAWMPGLITDEHQVPAPRVEESRRCRSFLFDPP